MMLNDIIEFLFRILPWICALLLLFAFAFEVVDALRRITREEEQRAQANKKIEEFFATRKDELASTQVSEGNIEHLQDSHMHNNRVYDMFDFEAAFLEDEDMLLARIKLMKEIDSIEDMTGMGVLGRGYFDLHKHLRMPRELEAFYPENGSTGLTPDAWSVAPVVGAMQQ